MLSEAELARKWVSHRIFDWRALSFDERIEHHFEKHKKVSVSVTFSVFSHFDDVMEYLEKYHKNQKQIKKKSQVRRKNLVDFHRRRFN